MAPVTEGSHGFETLLRILQKYSSTPTGLAGSKNLTTDKNFLICECVLYFFFEWATSLMGKNSNPALSTYCRPMHVMTEESWY